MTRLPIDEIVPVLNPVRVADLVVILSLTPARVRPDVAMAYAELDVAHWSRRAGLERSGTIVGRWLRQDFRLPFGGACRLAAVIGMDPSLLFADYV